MERLRKSNKASGIRLPDCIADERYASTPEGELDLKIVKDIWAKLEQISIRAILTAADDRSTFTKVVQKVCQLYLSQHEVYDTEQGTRVQDLSQLGPLSSKARIACVAEDRHIRTHGRHLHLQREVDIAASLRLRGLAVLHFLLHHFVALKLEGLDLTPTSTPALPKLPTDALRLVNTAASRPPGMPGLGTEWVPPEKKRRKR